MASCSTSKQIRIPQPDETLVEQLPFEVPVSTVGFTLSLTWLELAKQVNAIMPEKIMDDKDFNKDGLKIHLTKTGPIEFSFKINQIQTTVPVSARVWYRYGALGIYDVKEFRMKGTVYLLSQTRLEECAMITKSKIDKIIWQENPTLEFYGKKIPVGFAIDPIIESNATSIASGIDKSIKSMLDFKPILIESLQGFQHPILLSEDYKMWLQITPMAFLTNPLKMNTEKIMMEVNLRAKMKTTMGNRPSKSEKFSDIQFKSDTPMRKDIEIVLPVETSYEELGVLFTQQLKGTLLYDAKKKVALEEIKLWHSDKKLVIAVNVSGAVKGWIYLKGVPKFDEEKSEIYLDELDYHLNTKNVLVKSLNWMLSGKVLKLIQTNSRYSIKKDLEDLRTLINTELNGYKPHETIEVKFKLSRIKFDNIFMSNLGLVSQFAAFAAMSAKIG